MKKISVSVFFIIAGIIIFLGLTGYFGIHSYYGDTKKIYIKSIDDVSWDSSLSGGVSGVFSVKKGEKALTDDMTELYEVISKRISDLGFEDNEALVSIKGQRLTFTFPWNKTRTTLTADEALERISSYSFVEIRQGSNSDGDILLTNAEIRSVGRPTKNEYLSTYSINLKLSDDGYKIYKKAEKDIVDLGENISLWIDGEKVSEQKATTIDKDGVLTISSFVNPVDENYMTSIASRINSGAIPDKFELKDFNIAIPKDLDTIFNRVKISLFTILAICIIYMITVFKLIGAVGAVSILGQFAVNICIITGYFGVFPGVPLSIWVVIAFGLSMVLNCVFVSNVIFKIQKQYMIKNTSISNSIYLGGKNSIKSNLSLLSIVLILSIIVMIVFRGINHKNIFNMGLMLMLSSSSAFLLGHIALQTMLISLLNFNIFNSPSVYKRKKL